jgi:CBS domain-containing protein
MKVKDILKNKGTAVASIPADASLHDALERLIRLRIGSLVVVDGHDPIVGIITERDLLGECAVHPEGLKEMTVREIMSTNPIIAIPEDEVAYIMGIMTHNRIRHLPILDGERLAGMISIGDVVKAQLEAAEFENRYLKDCIQRG